MTKFLALTAAVLGCAGTASAQVFTPAQPMPAPMTPGVVQSGAYLPATVSGGVVTGQPYNLTPSVMGGTVVGMPGMTGNVYPQPFTSFSTGGTVVGGSYMANGSVPQSVTTFSPTMYPQSGMTYSQPVSMSYTSVPTTAGYSPVPFGPATSQGFGAGLTSTVTRVVNVPARAARRLLRR